MTSTADERRSSILEEIARNQMVKVAQLSERFGVSGVTIRRDLNRLEQMGLLKRVHGGAVAIPNAALGQSHAAKMRRHIEEKERIGRAAAQLIREGERLIFDSGTTVVQVARNISGDLLTSGNLTVITGSLPIVHELGTWKGVHLILLGGIYLPDYELVVGPQTIDNLEGLHADKMFLGTDGLTFSHGLTTANLLEAEVDRAMVKAASEVIVVADSSKIGVTGLTTIIPVTSINKLITDTKAPSDFVAALREQGVEVILV
jgi:DeoR/GlpR family transcriptional regulator of sugar metabolism